MSRTETPSETFVRFDQNSVWRQSPQEVLAADFLSGNGESNLLWTPFHYEEKDGRLFDPVRKQFVAGTANGNNVEEGVISQLENWFITHESGIGVWISPRNPYLEEQITLYRIGHQLVINEDGTFIIKKVLMFSWHQFKREFKNPEEIRQYIFTEDDKEESVLEIIDWLKSVSEKPVADNLGNIKERVENAKHYAHLYKSGVGMENLVYQMDQTKFLGSNPIGCPPNNTSTSVSVYSSTTTEFMGYESDDGLGPREFKCPACGYKNMRPHGGFVHLCQNPGDCPNRKAVICGA